MKQVIHIGTGLISLCASVYYMYIWSENDWYILFAVPSVLFLSACFLHGQNMLE